MSNNQTKSFVIVGKYITENRKSDCFGEIEIHRVDEEHKTANASWQIFDGNKIGIAGITRSYYFGEVNNPQEEILKMILIDIQKHKMNRRKVFSEIEVK